MERDSLEEESWIAAKDEMKSGGGLKGGKGRARGRGRVWKEKGRGREREKEGGAEGEGTSVSEKSFTHEFL